MQRYYKLKYASVYELYVLIYNFSIIFVFLYEKIQIIGARSTFGTWYYTLLDFFNDII
jgi:hypothetical protein